MNVDLLKQVADAIEKDPVRLDMSSWTDTDDAVAPCKTTACIAGWAVTLSLAKQALDDPKAWRKAVVSMDRENRPLSISDSAVEKLGITDAQSEKLFHADGWPKDLYNEYCEAEIKRDNRLELIDERFFDGKISSEQAAPRQAAPQCAQDVATTAKWSSGMNAFTDSKLRSLKASNWQKYQFTSAAQVEEKLRTITSLEACEVAVRLLKRSDAYHFAVDTTAKYGLGQLLERAIENEKEKTNEQTRNNPAANAVRSARPRKREA
jgi:hypothetical protein